MTKFSDSQERLENIKPTLSKKIDLEPALKIEKAIAPLKFPLKNNRNWVPLLLSLGVIPFGILVTHQMVGKKSKATNPLPTQANPVLTVTVQPVKLRTFPKILLVTGSLAAWDELPLGAEVSGLRIENVYVDEGDRVQHKQILAKLDDHVILAQVHQAEASINKMRSTIRQQFAVLQQAIAKYREAEVNSHRYNELLRQGAVSQIEAQTRQTNAATSQAEVESARQSIAVAQSDLTKAQAELESQRATLAKTRITAPVDGYISKRLAKLGSVTPPTGSVLFNLVRDGRIELNAEVSELDLLNIKPGQEVLVTSDAHATEKYVGKVREVNPLIDPQTRLGLVHIALPTNPKLKPGMFMQGELKLHSSSALVVPEAAVLFKDAKPFVFVLKGERVAARPIETGTRDQGQVEVRSGLVLAEQVVVAGTGYLKDGNRVRVGTFKAGGGK